MCGNNRSRQTIVKIESGERKADWYITQNVLARLGLKAEEIRAVINELLSDDEAYVVKKRDESYEKQYRLTVHDNLRYRELVLNICVAHKNAGLYGYITVSFEAGKKEYEETFGGKPELSVLW